jgi:hypothetical protein
MPVGTAAVRAVKTPHQITPAAHVAGVDHPISPAEFMIAISMRKLESFPSVELSMRREGQVRVNGAGTATCIL